MHKYFPHKLRLLLGLLAGSAVPLLASVDQSLLGLVPADAKLVIGIDAQRAKTSGFGQFILNQQSSANPDLQAFEQQTGFDPRRDLEYVLITSGEARDQKSNLVLARGLFDLDRIKAAAKAKGAQLETYANTFLIRRDGHESATAIAFPATGVAVAGPIQQVRSVLSGRSSPTVLDPRLTSLIAAADANDVWFASTLPPQSLAPEASPAKPGMIENSQALRAVREASGGVRLGETVQLTFDAITRSPQDANALADVVRFMSSAVQTKAQNDPRAAALLTSLQQMQLASSGPNLHLALQMPEKTLEQLQSISPKVSR